MKTSKLTKVVSVIGMVALVGCSEPRVEFDSNVLLSAKLLSFEGVMDKYKEKFKYSSEKMSSNSSYFVQVTMDHADVRKALYLHSCGSMSSRSKRCEPEELIDKLAGNRTPFGKYYSYWSANDIDGFEIKGNEKFEGFRTLDTTTNMDKLVVVLGPIERLPKSLTLNIKNYGLDDLDTFNPKFVVQVTK